MAEFFGVRHHSPTAARLVAERIRQDPPAAVLIEGPSQYSAELDQLRLGHQLPIMIYSWAPLFPDAEEGSAEWSARRGCFYPLTGYAPEWTAIQAAYAAAVPVEFIDLPWLGVVDIARAENRWAEAPPEADDDPAVTRLLTDFGVDDVAALLDEIIEVDPDLDLETYRLRAEMIGEILRRADDDPETAAREAYMAARIREAETRHPDGTVLVVCGAAHISGLRRLLADPAAEEPDRWQPPTDDDRYGVALTPTSYAALDALDGYNAGQPSPGFYDALYADRAAGRRDTAERLLAEVTDSLRRRRQFISPADLIAVLTTAKALAQLRGHPQVWRTDLLEAITTALVKDDLADRHPLLDHVRQVLRGDRVGRLAKGTRQPPLVEELRADLARLDIEPRPQQRTIRTDLLNPTGLEQSRLLHSLQVLEIPFGRLTRDITSAEADDGSETWLLKWSDSFEASLVAAARFGGSRAEAVGARLLSDATEVVGDPAAAAAIMLSAALCGVERLSADLEARTEELLATTGDLAKLGEAIGVLMQLYRYDPILRATGRTDLGRLVRTAFDRSLRLTERLPQLSEGPALAGLVEALRITTDTAERVGEALDLDLAGWDGALATIISDPQQAPSLRGAAMGGRWLTDTVPDQEVADALLLMSSPADMGDFVAGLLALAREAALRRPAALRTLDEVVAGWSETDFMAALPGLRRAFSGYTPRDRAQVADVVLGKDAAAALESFTGGATDALTIATFEAAVQQRVRQLLGVELHPAGAR